MSIVIRILSYADGSPCKYSGEYVREYDPDGADGRGFISTTDDPDDAMQFQNEHRAFAFWKMQSSVRPFRSDGHPNRPLTAFTIELEACLWAKSERDRPFDVQGLH